MTKSSLRKVANEADARACLAAMARSGMTLAEWSRSRRLDGRSLRAWRINLSRRRRSEAPESDARLVELVPAPGPSGAPRRHYVIRVGDLSVEVDDGFDATTLKSIVEVLQAC